MEVNFGVEQAEFSCFLKENLNPLNCLFLKDITINHHNIRHDNYHMVSKINKNPLSLSNCKAQGGTFCYSLW